MQAVGPDNLPLSDLTKIYRGCYARAFITAFGYDNESKGVIFALSCIRKERDGEPLGAGAVDAVAAFSGIPVAPSTDAPAKSSVDLGI